VTIDSGFGDWIALTSEGVGGAPDEPAAVQVARADKSLVQYAKGKSAMVFYFYAARSAREALKRLFADELDEAGARGQGALAFRVLTGGDEARLHLERLYFEFEERFGSPPVLHANGDDE
jgi:hypothetical protein